MALRGERDLARVDGPLAGRRREAQRAVGCEPEDRPGESRPVGPGEAHRARLADAHEARLDGCEKRAGRTLDYAHNPAAAGETIRRASRNVTAHRRMGVAQSEAFFSPGMEALGDVDAAAWDAMPESDREKLRGPARSGS